MVQYCKRKRRDSKVKEGEEIGIGGIALQEKEKRKIVGVIWQGKRSKGDR